MEDAQTFRSLISGSTESKGLAAVKNIDLSSEKGGVIMQLMRAQNKVVDLDELATDLVACLRKIMTLTPDDTDEVRTIFVSRYSDYVQMVNTPIKEVEDYLLANSYIDVSLP
eukprot:576349-Amphidinium_carterae.1